MDSKNIFLNFFRHFIICFGGIFYGVGPLFFLYQCIGLFYNLPGVFLHKVSTGGEQWWLKIDFKHELFIGFWLFLILVSLIYALLNIKNFKPYADPKVKSLSGF